MHGAMLCVPSPAVRLGGHPDRRPARRGRRRPACARRPPTGSAPCPSRPCSPCARARPGAAGVRHLLGYAAERLVGYAQLERGRDRTPRPSSSSTRAHGARAWAAPCSTPCWTRPRGAGLGARRPARRPGARRRPRAGRRARAAQDGPAASARTSAPAATALPDGVSPPAPSSRARTTRLGGHQRRGLRPPPRAGPADRGRPRGADGAAVVRPGRASSSSTAEDRPDEVAAFHWTKVDPDQRSTVDPSRPAGEVYVVGVHPGYQGGGWRDR